MSEHLENAQKLKRRKKEKGGDIRLTSIGCSCGGTLEGYYWESEEGGKAAKAAPESS